MLCEAPLSGGGCASCVQPSLVTELRPDEGSGAPTEGESDLQQLAKRLAGMPGLRYGIHPMHWVIGRDEHGLPAGLARCQWSLEGMLVRGCMDLLQRLHHRPLDQQQTPAPHFETWK